MVSKKAVEEVNVPEKTDSSSDLDGVFDVDLSALAPKRRKKKKPNLSPKF